MATARDMITRAFCELQVYRPGEQLLDVDAAQGLIALNAMLDSWSNESLTCYAILEQSVLLIPNVAQYTIGPGGMINSTRPLRLKFGVGAAYTLDTQGTRYPIDVVAQEVWNQITLSTINSSIPTVLFYDPQFPLAKLNFYPVPNTGGYTAYWDSYLAISTLPSLQTVLSLPVGYQEAIQLNLALKLKPIYPRAILDPSTIKGASDAKRNIKVNNQRDITAVFDPELIARSSQATLADFYRGGR